MRLRALDLLELSPNAMETTKPRPYPRVPPPRDLVQTPSLYTKIVYCGGDVPLTCLPKLVCLQPGAEYPVQCSGTAYCSGSARLLDVI